TRDALMKGETRLHDLLAEPPPAQTPPYAAAPEAEIRDSVEVRLSVAGGTVFDALITLEAVKDMEGRLLRTRSVVRHLTHERQTAEALAQSERRITRLFEAAPMGLALLDAEGRILEYNRSFAAMARPSGKLGKRQAFVEFFAEPDRPALQAALKDSPRSDGEAASGETAESETSPRQNGLKAPIELHFLGDPPRVAALSLSWTESLDDQQAGYVAYLEDVTEQKALEAQFVQGQKMQAVGQLAGGIAHDFNNLLTAMIGFSDLLLLRHRPGDQSFADIMQIKQNANRAANLVRQLLAFSRQQTLQPKVLDITDALAELSHLLRRLIGDTIELQLVHGRDLGLVRVDHGQFEQVIINLAVNARDAMAEGGRLVIKTSNVTLATSLRRKDELVPPGDYVLIEVIDSGKGIDPENLGRIFDPFFSTKDVGEGTGLGLSTVYGIVKQTGGHIYVESRAEEGTTFTIYLPQHRQDDDPAATKKTQEIAEKRDLTGIGTVLLVEDEDAVRAFSARALRNKGYDVLEARSGEAALEVLQNSGAGANGAAGTPSGTPSGAPGGTPRAIDLLITDIVMPRIDGVTLVHQVRETYPEMKVIFMSGYAEDAFRQRLDKIDGMHFLSKPFSLKELASKVKEVLAETSG
ncbi:MAG: ATP-binding protein, partial [Rhodovibrionaceae bacterium]